GAKPLIETVDVCSTRYYRNRLQSRLRSLHLRPEVCAAVPVETDCESRLVLWTWPTCTPARVRRAPVCSPSCCSTRPACVSRGPTPARAGCVIITSSPRG